MLNKNLFGTGLLTAGLTAATLGVTGLPVDLGPIALTIGSPAYATQMDCSKKQPDWLWSEMCRLQDRQNAGGSTSSEASSTALSDQQQQQLQQQLLNNQIELSPEQRQLLLNTNNISPELRAALSSTNTNTNSNVLNPSLTANPSASNTGLNNGVRFGDYSSIFLQPVNNQVPEVMGNSFTFRAYPGMVVCPTAAHAWNANLYFAGFGENWSSDQVSAFCEQTVAYLQQMNNIELIRLLLPHLSEQEQQFAASTAVTYLFSQVGVTYQFTFQSVNQVTTHERQFILVVPPERGGSNPPVAAPF